jgi:hypothetical protein
MDDDTIYFWECEGIYDFDGDLIADVLLSILALSFHQAIYTSSSLMSEMLLEASLD